MIKQLSIVGVGLIGGSLAQALKKAAYCKKIVGVGRNAERLSAACKAGIIDRGETDFKAGVGEADVILIATPLDTYRDVFTQIKTHARADVVITDAGSAKSCVADDARKVYGRLPENLVPGHPIAGNEKSGFEASTADLYESRRVVLTPSADTSPHAIATVKAMWEAAGACVEITDVEHHDHVLAATSHLPHLLAFGLVDSLARQQDSEELFRFAAGGFRDFTRIAASDPIMWRDICLRNRDSILFALGNYERDLSDLHTAIKDGDGETLVKIFTRAKQARDRFNY
jgi:prephenate dehydrogenase